MEQAVKKAEKTEKEGKGKDPHLEGKSKAFIEMYRTRFLLIKEATKYRERHNAALTIKYCHKYLSIIGQYFGVDEKSLHPRLFVSGDKDIPEMMLISLVYWDMARAFSVSDKIEHQAETVRLLDQFVNFSVGFKYQYLNSETLRKFIKRKDKRREDVTIFKNAYQKMHIKSKACYLATYCFAENDSVVEVFRNLKQIVYRYNWGQWGVETYYRFSPSMVEVCQNNPLIGRPIRFFLRPVLRLGAWFLVKFYR